MRAMTLDAPARADWSVRLGWGLSALLALFLLVDAGIKLVPIAVVTEMAPQMGWSGDPALWRGLGAVLAASTLLYLWPRTALIGAALLTAYLGGAVATHLRVGDALFTHTLFGAYLGVALWGGFWLRDRRLRALVG